MNQKESVFTATMAVASEAGITVGNASELPKTMRDQIVSMVTQSIVDGHTEFSAEAHMKHNTLDLVRKYVVGMVNNWFRKDVRLNGGAKYVAKNPGSRTGIADPQIKELKKLLDQYPAAAKDINAAIAVRQAEINATKIKDVVIDMSKIPEHLKALVIKASVTTTPAVDVDDYEAADQVEDTTNYEAAEQAIQG